MVKLINTKLQSVSHLHVSFIQQVNFLRILSLDTATWAVSSQGIQDDLGAKSTNWMAGWLTIRIVNLISMFV